jgi:transposase
MKKNQIIIGIDVSKSTLDVFIHSTEQSFTVENNNKGFAVIMEKCTVANKIKKKTLFFCFESTGKYSKQMSLFLQSEGIHFAMVPGLEIKKSLGITRGKNDKIDARRIALYAYEKRERLVPTVMPNEMIDKIKSLISLRNQLVKHRTAFKNGLTDLYDSYQEGDSIFYKEVRQRLIDTLDKEIAEIEKEIDTTIKKDPSIEKNFDLMLSVRGVGKIIAYYMLAYTNNFTKFVDPRSFACYAGMAPFSYSSGTVTGKSRVHPFANKQLKALFTMGAMTAINIKGEYHEYYKKRQQIGKNNMSTLNIIRNKIVFRIFAVVKRGTPYVDLSKFAA